MLAPNQDPSNTPGADALQFGPLKIQRLHRDEARALVRGAVVSRRPTDIAICNAHTILTALDNPDYAETLQSITLFNDGVGTGIAARILEGRGFPANLNGTDLVPYLLAAMDIPLRIYLLGAREAQVQGARAHIEATYPQHTVVGCRNGYFDRNEVPGICREINTAEPDLLLIAMGNPRQERFVLENRDALAAPVTIGVGALFDFMSGSVVRAPRAVQMIGLEWLFRMLQEPKRLAKRYLVGIPRFFLKTFWLKLAGNPKSVS